jgi:uncharacterized protein (TIGR02246 family)
MRALSLMFASVVVAALAGCAAPAQPGFGPTDRATVENVVQEFTAAYNAKDASRVASLFTSGAALMPPNASTLRGTDYIERYFAGRFEQGATDLVIEPTDIAGSGVLAYIAGNYDLRLAPEGGGEERDRGKFVWIVRGHRGTWLLEYLIFSSDFAPASSDMTAKAP